MRSWTSVTLSSVVAVFISFRFHQQQTCDHKQTNLIKFDRLPSKEESHSILTLFDFADRPTLTESQTDIFICPPLCLMFLSLKICKRFFHYFGLESCQTLKQRLFAREVLAPKYEKELNGDAVTVGFGEILLQKR